MKFKNITVAGGGVLGSQIAFQVAFSGFKVSVYDINDVALKSTDERFKNYMEIYKKEMGASQQDVEDTYKRLSLYSDLAEAVKDADLVVEAVPEAIHIKENFYTELAKVAPKHTVFASNSSTLPPSVFAHFTGRPEIFLTLHFCTEVWKHNLAEIMPHPGTDLKYFDDMIEFAKEIGMIPIPIKKEQPGYVLNTLLVPFLYAALTLESNEITTPESIDKTWMIASEAAFGPFAFMDMIGLSTCYAISKMLGDNGDPLGYKIADYIQKEYLDKGKLGKQAGEGFYKYPNPSYLEPNFIK